MNSKYFGLMAVMLLALSVFAPAVFAENGNNGQGNANGQLQGFLEIKVSNEKGDLISGALVNLNSGNHNLELTTGDDGKVQAKLFPDREYKLSVSKDGYYPHGEMVKVSSDETTYLSVVLAKPTAGEKGKFAIKVSDGVLGVMLEGANVVLHSLNCPEGLECSLPPHKLTTDSGGFASTELAAGEYKMTVSKDGYYSYGEYVKISSGQTTELSVALQKRGTEPRQAGDATLVVKVLEVAKLTTASAETSTSRPVSGALLTCKNTNSETALTNAADASKQSAVTDSGGMAKLELKSNAVHHCIVSKDGYQPFEFKEVLKSGQTDEKTIELKSGNVVQECNSELACARIEKLYALINVLQARIDRLEKLLGMNSGSNSNCVCTKQYNPVCGADGKTYGNKCSAECAGVDVVAVGECAGQTRPGSTSANNPLAASTVSFPEEIKVKEIKQREITTTSGTKIVPPQDYAVEATDGVPYVVTPEGYKTQLSIEPRVLVANKISPEEYQKILSISAEPVVEKNQLIYNIKYTVPNEIPIINIFIPNVEKSIDVTAEEISAVSTQVENEKQLWEDASVISSDSSTEQVTVSNAAPVPVSTATVN